MSTPRRLIPILLLGLGGSLAARQPAADGPPLAVEDLYRLDAPRDAALSPNGSRLAYVRQWIDPTEKVDRYSLWTVEDGKARPWEPGEPDARAPVFSPDGKWIAFLSARARPAGWKQTPPVPPQSDPAVDVWLIPTDGGVAVPLAGPDKPHGRVFNDGFYGRLAFSPDGTKLAFVADDGTDPRTPAERANGVLVTRDDQGEGYTGHGPAQLWVAHLDPNPGAVATSKIDRLTDDDVWYGDPNWSPDGTTIAVHANRTADRESARFSINKNFDVWLIDPATKAVRQLTRGPGPEVSPRFSPDGKRLVCLSVPRKGSHRDAFNLAVIDAVGPPEARVPYDHHAGKPHRPEFPTPAFPLPTECWLDPDHVLVTAEDGVNSPLVGIDLGTGRGVKVEPVKVDGPPRTVGQRLTSRAVLTPSGNTFLRERQPTIHRVVRWKSTDGLTIEGVLTLPAGAKPPHKLIVYPHGGPHSRSTLGFDFTVAVFAANGYAVLQPNFRGSSGYGQAFVDADRGDFGGGDMRDVLAGVDHLIADGTADRDRLFVYGISYGGYMTTWLVGQTTRFRAAVAQNAVTDLTMMWGLSDLPSWTEWEFGGRPWEVPEKMRAHSPLTYADRVTTPTLILHARDDRRCPLPMGQAYYRALRARGVPTELVVYPDEGHGIRQPRHREDVLRRTLSWFARFDGR
jgi:dipeptidyl aminopeptidase/acylaminoacyl peptidase